MRHSHTSRGLRTSAKTILAFVGLGLAGACSDSVSAPTSEVSFKAPAAYTTVVGVETFFYTPSYGATKRLGDHVIVIPAGGVCDPLTSGYGSAYWDAPCTPVSHSILITATMLTDNDGHPYVDFEPALRFVPTKETNLYLKDGKRTGEEVHISWCNNGSCIDESRNDPSLASHRIGNSRIIARRIKHFSGYAVLAGDYCPGTITVDPEGGLWCETDTEGSTRSGYMLASGLAKAKKDIKKAEK